MKTKGDRLFKEGKLSIYADEFRDKDMRKVVSRFGVQGYR